MDYSYQPVNAGWVNKFLPSYSDSVALAARNAVSLATKFCVRRIEIQNRSGGVANIGFGGRLKNDPTLWKAGQYVVATTTYTDDTPDAQDVGANDFPLSTLTNNDGFIVLSQIPFNILSYFVGTATVGGSPAYSVKYSLAGGSWSAALANMHTTPAFAAGEQVLWWDLPNNWAVTEAGHATGIPTGYYGILVQATTAPATTAPLADVLVPGVIVSAVDAVADDGVKVWDYGSGEIALPPQCDALAIAMSAAGLFSNVSGLYRLAG